MHQTALALDHTANGTLPGWIGSSAPPVNPPAGDGCVSARCRRKTRRPADRAMESYGTPLNGWRPGAGWGCPLVQVPVYCGAQVHGETPPQEGGAGRSTGRGMASSLSWVQ